MNYQKNNIMTYGTSPPKVAIIILNWNGKEDTIECLSSLKHITYPNYEILLVDNGSTDGSVECFKERYPEMKIIENEDNLGFSRGNNVALELSLKDKNIRYIALLNNDTKVEPYWLDELVKVAELDERVCSCQSKMLSMSDINMIDTVGISITKSGGAIQDGYGTKDAGQYNQIREIFGACAGAALYRREMLIHIGLFDEDFFAYYEDVDLALRARLAGWKCMYVPRAVAYHKHSSTLGKDSPFKKYLLERNVYYYIIKNLSVKVILKFLALRPIAITLEIIGHIKNKNFSLIKYSIKANIDAIKNIPKMLKKRASIQAMKLVKNEDFKIWLR